MRYQERINEDNRLIAEFMGGKYLPNRTISFPRLTLDGIVNNPELITDLKYHYDMNWLVEVLEKINNFQDVEFKLVGSRASIKVPDGKRFVSHTISILNSMLNLLP